MYQQLQFLVLVKVNNNKRCSFAFKNACHLLPYPTVITQDGKGSLASFQKSSIIEGNQVATILIEGTLYLDLSSPSELINFLILNRSDVYPESILSTFSASTSIRYRIPETSAASLVKDIRSSLDMYFRANFLVPAMSCWRPVTSRS